jgi:hypothetical protein
MIMPAKSPEAVARKAKIRKARERKASAAKRIQIMKSDLPCYKISARRMLPRLPLNITKAELREMIAQAAANTAVD